MAFLFHKFQEAVKILAKNPAIAKNPVFARDPWQLQFEADINRLFLYTSYNLLGKNACEEDAEEIIEMANQATVAVQQAQVQENVHSQIKAFCRFMDEVLIPNEKVVSAPAELSQQANASPHSGSVSDAMGRRELPIENPAAPIRRSLTQAEVSQKLKDQVGFTLYIKPSQISHKDAGQGYLDETNPYLITRYDRIVIDARPWGSGGERQELWNARKMVENNKTDMEKAQKGSENLNNPLKDFEIDDSDNVLERRNPLALAHFANHPAKGVLPNVMVCPYDFPLTESNMRAYIPNISAGNGEDVNRKRFGSFRFKSGVASSGSESDVPTLKSVVLVATRNLEDEELFLNYRLSKSKQWPQWYDPVHEEPFLSSQE